MKIVFKQLGILILIASVIYFANTIINNYSLIKTAELTFLKSIVFGFCILLYVLTLLMGAAAWSLLLRDSNQKFQTNLSYHIYLTTQLGKYLPGNIGQHIGRVVLANKFTLSAKVTISTMTFEIIITSISCALLSLMILAKNKVILESLGMNIQINLIWPILFVIIFICVLYMNKTNKIIISIKNKFNDILKTPSRRTVIKITLINLLNYFILGFIILLLINFVFEFNSYNIFYVTGVFSLAWIIGFVTPGSPGGIGVREAILIALLSPVYGPSISVGISIVLRLITIIGDGFGFVIGYLIKPESKI